MYKLSSRCLLVYFNLYTATAEMKSTVLLPEKVRIYGRKKKEKKKKKQKGKKKTTKENVR